MQHTIDGFRLSPQQERLWLLQQQSPVYWAYCSVEITGSLQETWLRQALQTICTRHGAFRTRFHRLPGMTLPLQVVEGQSQLLWRSFDLREVKAHQKQQVLAELAHVMQEYPPDVEEEALLHCTLLTLAEQHYLLWLSVPSLIADRGTLILLTDELVQGYVAQQSGVVQDIDGEEVLQYLQFSEWQRSLLEDEGVAQQQEVDFIPSPSLFSHTNLPFTAVKGQTAHFTPARFTLSVDPQLWANLQFWLAQQSTSLPVFLLSCWAALLGRLCNDQEFLLGVQVDGRLYQDLTGVAGHLEKVLPLLCPVDSSLPFIDLLTQVQQRYEHLLHLYPTFSYQTWLTSVQREASAPLAPFGFAYKQLNSPYQVGALTFSVQECVCYSEPFSLCLVALQQSNELRLQWLYHAELFTPSTVAQLAQYLLILLHDALSRPLTPLGQLSLLSPSQCQHQLYNLAPSELAVPPQQELYAVIAQQAAHTPDTIAIEEPQGQLSYQALLLQATHLARVLRAHGVGPEQLVGVYQKRTGALLVSLLAILQTGGAYLPLDPQTPLQRLQWILQQTGTRCILSNNELATELPAWEGSETLVVEQVLQKARSEPETTGSVLEEAAMRGQLAGRLAYVMYTSGSTGEPKGVMVSQQGLAAYVCWASQYYRVALGTGAPVHSSLAFDLSVTSLFTPLVEGRRVVLVEETAGVEGLSRVIREQGKLSLVKLTPAHLDLLNQSLSSLEKQEVCHAMVIGGEALHAESLQEWLHGDSPPRLINEYGPTETVVGCCIYEVLPVHMMEGNVPIGRPIPHAQLYVLDQYQQLVPQGVTGELYIGGIIVARGYLGRPDLTAERFVPHPFSRQAGARLYKTGDLVRYKDELGTLEYLGRVDRQVKLRGYRIELAEIEHGLLHHPLVRDVVVLLREHKQAQPQLVAYIVPRQLPGPTFQELRDFVRECLPAYMVPSTYVYLKFLPLTINGKVDWQRLITAEENQDTNIISAINLDSQSKTVVPPRDEVEIKLLHIWERILQVHSLSILDSFFDLGGHSMLAISLLSHVSKQFGQDLPLDTLFQNPTIADLALVLRQKTTLENRSILVALQTHDSRPPFFCVHSSGGTVFCYLNLARHLGPDQPFYGLQSPISDTAEDVFATLEDMAASYISAIQSVQPSGPYLLGGWSMGGVVAFEMAQQLQRQGHTVALLAIFDTRLASSALRMHAEKEQIQTRDEEIAQDILHQFKIIASDDFAQLEPTEQLNWAVEQAKKSNALPADVDLSYVRRIARIDKVNNHLARLYMPKHYQQRMDYFYAEDAIQFREDGMKQKSPAKDAPGKPDYVTRWYELGGDAMKIHRIPGNHSGMIEEPNVQALAASLRSCIDDACR